MLLLMKKSTRFLGLSVGLSILLFMPLAQAQKVEELSIKGNQEISSDLIRSHISLKKGTFYSPDKAHQDIKQLFSLGFFEDIQIHRSYTPSKKLKLSYHFKERPFISTISFEGHKKMNTKELKEISLLEEYQFLDPDKLQKTLQAIKKKYEEKAYYLMTSSYELKKDTKNKKGQKLIIKIEENFKVFIQSIHFIGNRNIKSKTLKQFLKNKERNLLSFLGASGVYQASHIDQDLQLLEYYYRDQGYLNVRIQQPEISISPDKKKLSLYFKITEGPRYKVGKLYFEGDEVVSQTEVSDHFTLSKKEYFSLRALQTDMQRIAILYKNKGYAFAEVSPSFQNDSLEENKLHIFFEVNKGDLYKLRRIQISGNKQARDRVILRRFRITEGDLYNQSQIDLSRQLLEQLSIFEKVEIIPQVSGLVDSSMDSLNKSLDLKVNLTERENTGELTIAGGFNSQTRLYLGGGLKKNNFLGLDQDIGFRINLGRYDETIAFNYQNSYIFDTKWNFIFDIFNSANQNFTSSGLGVSSLFFDQRYLTYFSLSTGFSFSLGRYLNNFSKLFVKYKLSNENLSDESIYFIRTLPVIRNIVGVFEEKTPLQTQTKVEDLPLSSLDDARFLRFHDIYDFDTANGLNSSLSLILEYDKRNDRFYPSKGFYGRLSLEYSGLGGDFNYNKGAALLRHYYNPFWKLVVKNRLELGFVFSNNDKEVPFTQLFLLGGPYDLRGFAVNSQGPKKESAEALKYAEARNKKIKDSRAEDSRAGDSRARDSSRNSQYQLIASPKDFAMRPYGGEQKFVYSLELEVPLIESMGLRATAFIDVGEANKTLSFDLSDQLRANAGVGIRWRSPFGPLSLDWAVPYEPRKRYQEKPWEIQFSMGAQL